MTETALTSAAALADAGLIQPGAIPGADRVARRYAVRVTPEMAALMADDAPAAAAIQRQFLPDPAELETSSEEHPDPIGDDAKSPLPGLVHRYPDRVLLKPVHVCPVYCRFCFRRETVGAERAMTPAEIDAAFAYIAARPEIWEVILTGGDPLMLKPAMLARIVKAAEAIPHLKILRVHSRVPVADPGRIDDALIAAMKGDKRLAAYVSVHANHPAELTPAALAALARLADAGLPLLGQTVLLKGVNDDVETLTALMRGLVAARVQPYYLHHPDLAPGTARFRLGLDAGRRLVEALRGRISGLCQPTYVLDIPGGHGKAPAAAAYAEPTADAGKWRVRDPFGGVHAYPPDIAGAADDC